MHAPFQSDEPWHTDLRPGFMGQELSSHFSGVFVAEERFNKICEEALIFPTIQEFKKFFFDAINEETNPFLLCTISKHWLTQQLDDLEMGEKALHKAEEVSDSGKLIASPLTRWKVFHEKHTALQTLGQYIDSAEWPSYCEQLQTQGLLDVARLCADLGGSQELVFEILEQAEQLVLSSDDCYQCSELHRKLLPGVNRQQYLLKQSESFVSEIDDWYDIILQYSIEERVDDVRRCLALAGNQAKSFHDWDYLAGMVRHTSDDEHLFRKCMEQVESLVKSPNDWKVCAKTWETYLSKEEADRCLKCASELEET